MEGREAPSGRGVEPRKERAVEAIQAWTGMGLWRWRGMDAFESQEEDHQEDKVMDWMGGMGTACVEVKNDDNS